MPLTKYNRMQLFNNFLQKVAFHLFLKSKFSSGAYPVFLELLNTSKYKH